MSGHQLATLEDTVFFWFAANDTSGSGGDGSAPLFDVREAGAAAGAAPLLSGTPSLLSNAAYPVGCFEVAVAATAANGFAENDTFAVFSTLLIDSQNPTGFIGSCTLTPLAKVSELAKVPKSDGAVSWNATALAAINGEVDTALRTTTDAEISEVPAAASSPIDKLGFLFSLARNKGSQTSTLKTLRNDVDGVDIGTSSLSDDGTTVTRGKWS